MKQVLEKAQAFGLICAVTVFVLFSGCETPPPPAPGPVAEHTVSSPPRERTAPPATPAPLVNSRPQEPLTVSIIQRLGESLGSLDAHVDRFQFVISGKIVLERDYSVRNDTFEEGNIPNFEDEHIKEVITINDKTEGQAMGINTRGGRIVLSVCFEENDDHRLFFSCPEGDPDSPFYFDYTPVVSGEPSGGEEKGTLRYAENNFRLLFAGETRPHLLINLSQKDIDTLNARTAPGRRARSASRASSD